MVTNVGYAHIEFFHRSTGLRSPNGNWWSLFPRDGVAVLNADDERVARFGRFIAGARLLMGSAKNAEVRGFDWNSAGGVRFRCNGVEFRTPLTGRHGALNVLAGIATAQLLRSRRRSWSKRRDHPDRKDAWGAVRSEWIHDSERFLQREPGSDEGDAGRAGDHDARRRVAVLGEMLELGAQSEALHRAVGAHAAQDAWIFWSGFAARRGRWWMRRPDPGCRRARRYSSTTRCRPETH